MEHEVAVPFPIDEVQRVLADPGRLRRCVPGLQVKAGGTGGAGAGSGGDPGAGGGAVAGHDEVSGRLRLRVGGSTITYRGVLRVSAGEGEYRIEAEGDEVRGTGTVKATLVITPEAAEGATILRMSGRAVAGGRLAAAGTSVAVAAGRRLLDRFAAALGSELAAGTEPGEAAPRDDGPVVPPLPAQVSGPAEPDTEPEPGAESQPAAEAEADEGAVPGTAESLDTPAVPEVPDGSEAPIVPEIPEIPEIPEVPEERLTSPASPAAGRRTMIGRSAEEVDHAPPRGRYAPVAVPENGRTGALLRWAAPAAAALVASAVVVGRILRRRR